MNISGLDYNTSRAPLILLEYGRAVQKMIAHAMSLPTKADRRRCAETIVKIMEIKNPQGRDSKDSRRRLWDHLAIMSNFLLDIDYPSDISNALRLATPPAPLAYRPGNISTRHYGRMLEQVFEHLKTMPEGPARSALVRATANQMRRSAFQWGHGMVTDEKIAADLERFTDGVVKLDLRTFRFEKINPNDFVEKKKKKH